MRVQASLSAGKWPKADWLLSFAHCRQADARAGKRCLVGEVLKCDKPCNVLRRTTPKYLCCRCRRYAGLQTCFRAIVAKGTVSENFGTTFLSSGPRSRLGTGSS